MAAEDDEIIKKGLLQRFSTREKKFVDKYFVLYRASERNAARLDWYDDEKSYHHSPTVRKTLFMEEMIKAERVRHNDDVIKQTYGDVGRTSLLLRKHRSPDDMTLLKANKSSVADDWLKEINGLLEHTRTQSLRSRTNIPNKIPSSSLYQPRSINREESYDVEVDDTAAANICNLYGTYRLVLTNEHITLVNTVNDTPVLSWQYSHVRRYGFSGNTFMLEGGHRCANAAGLFIFKSCHGADIRSAVENKMASLQTSKQQTDAYAYVGFDDVKQPISSESTSTSASTMTSSDNKLKQLNSNEVVDEKTSANKSKPKPKPVKPKPKQTIPLSNDVQTKVGPPKMSEIIGKLSTLSSTSSADADEVDGYSSIDLMRTAVARVNSGHQQHQLEQQQQQQQQQQQNLYGQALLSKRQSNTTNEPESAYAEIGMG